VDGKIRLVEKILAGETSAFEELVKEHQRLVGHIVFRMVPNRGDREDICQEVFMKVYKNLSRFRGESKLSTWIAKIAYNRCFDYLGTKKIPVVNESFDDTIAIPDDNSTPDRDAELSDISIRLRSEIEDLPPQSRVIITLYHLDELSYAEIGQILKLPEGTVKSHLFRSRKLLKRRLLSKYNKEELWQ